MLINGVYPGPTIRAKWGDTLIINVKNNLQHNGTGIHWHGVRQLNACQHDGVPGVTECPIAPGKSRQYKFRATQFGTTWYHSHWSAQYGDGVLGTMIIDGPATANYDEDLGVLPITDWYYTPVFTLNEVAQHSLGGPPIPDNILVNGTHVNKNGGGSYAKINVVKVSVDICRWVMFTNGVCRGNDTAFVLSILLSTIHLVFRWTVIRSLLLRQTLYQSNRSPQRN